MRRLAAVDAHEGPVVIGDFLYFTTLPRVPGETAIRRLSLGDGGVRTVVAEANAANGMNLLPDGRLVVCEQGTLRSGAAISAIEPATGAREVLTDAWEGRPLNSPNDVAVRSDGTVWFTDPSYGFLQGFRPRPRAGDHVYRLDPATGRTELAGDGFDKPNGLAFSPDESELYVGDNGAGRLYAVDVATGARRLLARFEGEHPDGLKVGPDGLVYASSVRGIDVLAPGGERVATLEIPGAVNFWFDGSRLYVTADTAVWAAEAVCRECV